MAPLRRRAAGDLPKWSMAMWGDDKVPEGQSRSGLFGLFEAPAEIPMAEEQVGLGGGDGTLCVRRVGAGVSMPKCSIFFDSRL